MCSAVKDMFKAIAKMLKAVWDAIRPYLAYIAIIVMIFAPYLIPMLSMYLSAATMATLTTAFGSLLTTETLVAFAIRAAVGLAIAYCLDSEAAQDVVDGTTRVLAEVAESAGALVGTVVGAAASGFFDSPVGTAVVLGLLGFAAFKLFGGSAPESNEVAVIAAASDDDGDEEIVEDQDGLAPNYARGY